MMFLSLLALASSPAFADDATTTAKTEAHCKSRIDSSPAATAACIRILTAENVVFQQMMAPRLQCGRARTVWVGLQTPLDTARAELTSIPASSPIPEIAADNAARRTELGRQIAEAESQRTIAKREAKTAGTELRRLQGQMDILSSQHSALLDAEEKADEEAWIQSCMAGDPDGGRTHDSCEKSLRWQQEQGPFATRPGGSVGRLQLEGPVREPVWLPSEFGACFPDQVKPPPAAPPAPEPPPVLGAGLPLYP